MKIKVGDMIAKNMDEGLYVALVISINVSIVVLRLKVPESWKPERKEGTMGILFSDRSLDGFHKFVGERKKGDEDEN